jgi:hypothetical protein
MLLGSGIPVMYNQARPSHNNFVLSGELFSFQDFYFSVSKVPATAAKHPLATIYSNNRTEFEDYELMTVGTHHTWVPNCMEFYPSRQRSFTLFMKHTNGSK